MRMILAASIVTSALPNLNHAQIRPYFAHIILPSVFRQGRNHSNFCYIYYGAMKFCVLSCVKAQPRGFDALKTQNFIAPQYTTRMITALPLPEKNLGARAGVRVRAGAGAGERRRLLFCSLFIDFRLHFAQVQQLQGEARHRHLLTATTLG